MTDWVNTNELRFVVKDLIVSNAQQTHQAISRGVRILQQRWVKVGTLHSEPLTPDNSEWRDVPLVEDEK